MTDAAEPARRRVSRVALGLLIVAFLTVVAAAAYMGAKVVGSLTQPAFAYPGTTTVDIGEPAMYALFEQTGSEGRTGPVTYSQNGGPVLRPGDVTVTGPGGQRLSTAPVDGMETLRRDGLIFTASVEFRATEPGPHTIEVGGRSAGGSAVVARELSDQFRSLLPVFLVALLSGVVVAGSAIATFVSALRAARANRPPRPSRGRPPGGGQPQWGQPGAPPQWGQPGGSPGGSPQWRQPGGSPGAPSQWGPAGGSPGAPPPSGPPTAPPSGQPGDPSPWAPPGAPSPPGPPPPGEPPPPAGDEPTR